MRSRAASRRGEVQSLYELREEELGIVVGGSKKEPEVDIKVEKDGTVVITIKIPPQKAS